MNFTNKIYKIVGVFGLSLFGLSACVASNSNYQNGSSYGTYQPKPVIKNGVVSEKWYLSKINNAPYQGKRITLNLSSENKASGFSGCNRYFISNVEINGSQLSFGTVGSTKMLCTNYESNQAEKEYLNVLRSANHFQRSNNSLVLEGGSGSLIFYKKSGR